MDDPCNLGLLGLEFNVGECAKAIGIGLVPDWVWSFLHALPWILGTVLALIALFVLIQAYRFGGWVAVVGVIGIVAGGTGGYFLTRKKAAPPLPRRAPSPPPAKKRRRVLFDFFRRKPRRSPSLPRPT